jgi:integrase
VAAPDADAGGPDVATIRKDPRNPKRWQVRYRDPNGTERTRSFRTAVDAKAFRSTLEVDIVRGEWIDPSLGRTLFDDWRAQWWATTTANRPSTRARDESLIRNHITPTFGARPLGSITQLDVKAWVVTTADALAPASVRKAYQLLSNILSAAVDAGLIATTPCRRIALPKVDTEEMRFLEPAEVARLIDTIHPRYAALVMLGCYGGLRIGELAGLRWSRVDLVRAKVEIAETAVEVKGVLRFGKPKTRASRRIVTVPRPVVDALTAHRSVWPADDDLVFSGPAGGGLRTPAWRARFWRPAVVAADLWPLRPHDMRHTAIALWIAAGAQPLEISRRAGHTSVSFTLDRYGHLMPGADKDLSDRLEALITASADASHRRP